MKALVFKAMADGAVGFRRGFSTSQERIRKPTKSLSWRVWQRTNAASTPLICETRGPNSRRRLLNRFAWPVLSTCRSRSRISKSIVPAGGAPVSPL